MIKNLLALIGTLVVLGLIFAFVKFEPMIKGVSSLDKQAMPTYMDMFGKVLATGDPAKGMTRVVEVKDGIKPDDIVDTIKEIAEENNMAVVGDTTMFDGSTDEDGKKTQYTRIVSICSRSIAKVFLNFSEDFGAFMPCRIMIREGKDGKLRLITMGMELMIHGGKPLPEKMLKLANHVKDTMYKAMDAAATGDDL